MRFHLVVFLCLLLAACGARPDRATAPAQPVASDAVTAPDFGDADPHLWEGRPPQRYAVHGIDISRWQTYVDWQAARAA